MTDSPQHRSESAACYSMRSRFAVILYSVCMLSMFVSIGCGPVWDYEPEQDSMQSDAREPVEIALDYYEASHGQAQAKCVQEAYEVEFIEMDSDELAVTCSAAKNAAAACYYRNDIHGPKVAIDYQFTGLKRLRAHEIMHVIIECHRGNLDADGLHTDPVWLQLDPEAAGHTLERHDWHPTGE